VPAFTALLHLPLTGPVRFVSDFISGIMQLSVTGQQLDVGNAPRRRPETDQTAAVIQYSDGAQEADIVFSREVPVFGADSHHMAEEFNSAAPLKRMASIRRFV
jgi:hypothetical protein